MDDSRLGRTCIVLLVCGFLAISGTALAQLQTGNLYGTVSDNQGEPLPGVTVTLTGVGAPRVQVTNAEGGYRFLNLPPGSYQLSAELEGFSTVEYPSVVIGVGRNTTIDVTLTEAVKEVITVTADAPLLDERRTTRGVNVSSEELEKIPTARDPWSLLNQTPGVIVDRINVGGNESGQQSNFLGTGAMDTENTFAIDGVIMTDMAAVGASLSYYDFGAYEEVQMTTGSTDVSIATAGVTVNQVTKRGSNQWAFNARFLRTDGDLQSGAKDIQGAPGNAIDKVDEWGGDLGGALWKDHLWIWAAYGESDIGNLVPAAGGEQQLDRTQLEDLNTKLNFQASSKNNGVFHYWTNDKLKSGRGAGPDRSPETTEDQTTPADIWKFEDTHVFSSSFFVTGLWSNNTGYFTLTPKGGIDADVFWDADGVLHGSYYVFAQKGVVDQWRIDASTFFKTGNASHELKFGGGFREQENHSDTTWPRGKIVYSCEFFGCSTDDNQAFVQLWANKSLAVNSSYDSAWIQDTITWDRLTLNFGLRYDKQDIENLPSVTPANVAFPDYIPQVDFAGNDAGGFTWENIVPRIGVTYALADGKTLLRGSFSQYAEQLGQGLAQRTNPAGYAYAAFYFNDDNQNLVLDPDEVGSLYYYYYYNFDPDNPTSSVTPNVTDPNLDASVTSELSFGFEHTFTPNFLGGVTVTYRNLTDIPETQVLIVDENGTLRPATRDDYELAGDVCAEEEGGCVLPDGSVVTGGTPYYTLKDSVSPTGGKFYTNGDREQDYLAVTLVLNKRMANRWSLRGHFTWSDWTWNVPDSFFLHDDPTDRTNDSNSDELRFSDNDGDPVAAVSSGSGNKKDIWANSRWLFNVTGLYQVAPDKKWGFNLGGAITGREGFPSPVYAGSARIQVGDFDQFRNDDIIYVDARIDKDFKLGNDVNLNVGIDGFNLFSNDAVLQRERNLFSGQANQVRERMSPRVFRVGFKLTWR